MTSVTYFKAECDSCLPYHLKIVQYMAGNICSPILYGHFTLSEWSNLIFPLLLTILAVSKIIEFGSWKAFYNINYERYWLQHEHNTFYRTMPLLHGRIVLGKVVLNGESLINRYTQCSRPHTNDKPGYGNKMSQVIQILSMLVLLN